MSPPAARRRAGFTLSELMVGISLSLIVMAAVLSSYVYVMRSYTKLIGFGLPNQPTLESQGRRSIAYFTMDVEAASAISSAGVAEVTLTVPASTGGTKNVTYYYNDTSSSVAVYSVTVQPMSLTRIDRSTSTALTLHTSLLAGGGFSYYDTTGNSYALSGYSYITSYLIGVKAVAMAFSCQSGSATNGTLTNIYRFASPQLLLRNKPLLP